MNELPDELARLLDYCQSLANLLLENQGEFYPFGVYINSNGVITQRLFNDGDDYPLSTALIKIIKHDFEQLMAAGITAATAIAYDGKVKNDRFPEPANVIIVRLIMNNLSAAIIYYLPYQLTETGVEYTTGWMETEQIN
jgi:hypothetical protein